MNKLSRCVGMLSGILMLVGSAEATQHLDRGESTEATRLGNRGDLLSSEKIGFLTRDEIAASLAEEKIPGVPRQGVSLYKVTYLTIDHHGQQTVASGAVAIPEAIDEPAPLLSFQHGTIVARHRAPSVKGFDLVSMGLGASGYITVMPDYLGLGSGTGFHPYVHAKSSGTVVVDMIRAARAFLEKEAIHTNGQLFLMGYSEGGYVTMAAHREIEQHHSDEISVTASAPMAGPYNLSQVMVEQILEESPYPSPGYLPFTLLAYDMVYDVFEQLEDVILPEYIQVVESMLEGKTGLRHINRQLPAVPLNMLTPAFIDSFKENAAHPLRVALEKNDIHNWKPLAPMRLYHCVDDEQVSFRNAEMALQAYQEHGAEHVELAKLTFGGHNACAPPALFLGKLWFDGFVENTPGQVFQANMQIIRAGTY
ncbi:MAG: lipase family protein [Rhodothermaceae bacterium]|nr:lipase family protein [Rhodothermaceae bacterium]